MVCMFRSHRPDYSDIWSRLNMRNWMNLRRNWNSAHMRHLRILLRSHIVMSSDKAHRFHSRSQAVQGIARHSYTQWQKSWKKLMNMFRWRYILVLVGMRERSWIRCTACRCPLAYTIVLHTDWLMCTGRRFRSHMPDHWHIHCWKCMVCILRWNKPVR